jgi:hypothetical protein
MCGDILRVMVDCSFAQGDGTGEVPCIERKDAEHHEGAPMIRRRLYDLLVTGSGLDQLRASMVIECPLK